MKAPVVVVVVVARLHEAAADNDGAVYATTAPMGRRTTWQGSVDGARSRA